MPSYSCRRNSTPARFAAATGRPANVGAAAQRPCELRERAQPPRVVDVAREKPGRLAGDRQVADEEDECVDRTCELVAPLPCVQVGGDRLHGTVVDVELAVRIAAGRDQQQRTTARAVQLGLVELHRLPGEVCEHRPRIAELTCVDADVHLCDGIGPG